MTHKRPHRLRLGEMLVESKVLSKDVVDRVLEIQKKDKRKLGTLMMKEGLIDERCLLELLKRQMNVEVISSESLVINEAAWNQVSLDLIKKYSVVPLQVTGRELTLAMSDPFNLIAIDAFKFATGCRNVKVILAADFVIESTIRARLDAMELAANPAGNDETCRKAMSMLDLKLVEALPQEETREEAYSTNSLELEAESAPIISLVNYIFLEAFKRRASDIHFESYQDSFRVRIRVDGTLHTIINPPISLSLSIVSRVKIMANMDIAKRLIPQDAHLYLKIKGESVHFRVSSLPTIYGEKLVLRVIRKRKILDNLELLGFCPEVLERYKRTIRIPQGMILFTGPTGSGKTTTLYATLHAINSTTTNIITLEDPVESTIHGINHVQIRHGRGLGFAEGLRTMLRQDPDVIFVGEIRDGEVAEIAMQAAMTGHLVFSTLHANSTSETFERLVDMGVEPYLVSNTILAVVSQRLLRRVCPACREPHTPTREEIADFKLDEEYIESGVFYIGRGCDQCMNTGYYERIAAYEVLFMSRAIQALVKQNSGAEAIKNVVSGVGYRTIVMDGLEKVRQGITTFEEVKRQLATQMEF